MLVEGNKIWGKKTIKNIRKNILIYGNVLTLYEDRYIGF